MPLALKSTGMALRVFEPSPAPASPASCGQRLVQGHPQGPAEAKADKALTQALL